MPTFIVEQIDLLNKALEHRQYFFTDVVRQGIKLYDSGEYTLAKPRKLSFKEIRNYAQVEYDIFYPDGTDFIEGANLFCLKEKYRLGSFMLHQACERFYHAISLVFINYKPQTHKLRDLAGRVKGVFERVVDSVSVQR